MDYAIKHSLPGRIRLDCGRYAFDRNQAYALGEHLKKQKGVLNASVSARTGTALIFFEAISQETVCTFFKTIDLQEISRGRSAPPAYNAGEEFALALSKKLIFRYIVRPLLPFFLRKVCLYYGVFCYIKRAVEALSKTRKLTVETLDASAISCAVVQNDHDTASSIMFLLSVSDLIEEWTTKKSKADLAEGLALNVDKVWLRQDCVETEVPLSQIAAGDIVIVRSGSLIPVDGSIVEGEALVNQSTMTGEPLPVKRSIGNTVFAGTAVEDGFIAIKTMTASGDTRLNKIIKLIEQSEKYKSNLQKRTENLADKIVPLSFLSAFLTYALTRNFAKAASILLVDYSCAIKLSGALSVLGALKESAGNKMFVKGARALELFAEADTIVFDKTGTLTVARPSVTDIIPFGGHTRGNILKLAACLEEHFPHSVAKAVVRQAAAEGIKHQEEHSKVEYIIAHGIASQLNGERVLIGSRHFIFEDEKTAATQEQLDFIAQKITTESSLYLAIGGKLAGMLLIEDPIRESAKDTIKNLYAAGFKKIVMLTGDTKNTARNVAEQLGIGDYQAELLPEQKAAYIEQLKQNGHTVVMVGDGINDTPALSAADVGVSMKNGSDIAREVSDISMLTPDLDQLVTLKRLSAGLIERINNNYRFILSFNTSLLALSLFNLITPALSATLHNTSTIGVGLYSLSKILKPK